MSDLCAGCARPFIEKSELCASCLAELSVSIWHNLLVRFVFVEFLIIVGILLILAVRGCL